MTYGSIFALLKRISVFLIFLVSASTGFAQIGGTGVFSVLKQPATARVAAWGGYCNAFRTGDANLMFANPALLGPENQNRGSMNFNTQFKGVWSGNGAYAFKYKNIGYFGVGVSFINYGTMNAYDAGGNSEGTTHASETEFALGFSRHAKYNISYGVNLKVVYSVLGPYIGNGAMFDAGATWTRKDSTLSVGAVLKNAGMMVNAYGGGKREPLPFQAEVGVNFKPQHMPFRFNIVAHDLQRFDMTYSQYLQNTTLVDLNGQSTKPQKASFGDKMVRHFTAGTELVLGKNFGVLFGYNHQRRRELGPDVKKGVSGFSWGLHFKVSKFIITYSSACYFPGFNTNLFTFSTGLAEFKKKSPSSRTGGK